jgi:hypothetical protein
MSDAVDVDTLTAAAAEAASQNDPVAAESLLRLALDLQIAASGPDHPDLATTLNNLALMLERQGNAAEAERCYRQAYDIARRGLPADDPLVTVSRDNLLAFLQSTGVQPPVIDEPARMPAAPVTAQKPPAARTEAPAAQQKTALRSPAATSPPAPAPPTQPKRPAQPARERPVSTPFPTAPARAGRSLTWLLVTGAVAGIVAVWLVLARPQSTEAPTASPDRRPSADPAGSSSAPATAPERAPVPPAATDTPPSAAAARPAPPPAARGTSSTTSASPTQGSTVSADGHLCISLTRGGGEWRCDAAGDRVGSDAVYYYTRVRTPRDAVVRHRWTYQGEVVRTVNLQVRANAEPGFRTFSRQIVTSREPGPWEVALLAPDGEVIDSQRFTVTGTRNQELGGRR